MKHKIGIFCMILGLLLVTSSLLLFLHNRNENVEAGKAVENILHEMEELIAEENPSDSEEMIIVEIDGYGYIGHLSIPKLELSLPIMSEWDYERLKIAPCRQFGSTKSDDLIIAGHNYDAHFGRLSQLEYGDLIMFTDMEGIARLYAVSAVETLQSTQVTEMKSGEWDLTLYTCTYGGQSRVTVRFVEVDSREIYENLDFWN